MSNQKPTQQLSLPQRDSVTSVQLGTLLHVAAMMSNIVYSHPEETEGGKNDGGAKMAAETTLIGACDQMDKILQDQSRWSFEAQSTLESELIKMYGENTKLIQAQTRLAELNSAPHVLYRPSLMALSDGNWAAILGSLDNLDNSVTGIGDTPESALSAFDLAFKGGASKDLIKWLSDRQTAVNKGESPPPFPKNNENTELDDRRNIPPSGDANQQNSPKRDGSKIRKKPDSSSPQA
jgi:hypothetical protein